jgi:hypothetical protein
VFGDIRPCARLVPAAIQPRHFRMWVFLECLDVLRPAPANAADSDAKFSGFCRHEQDEEYLNFPRPVVARMDRVREGAVVSSGVRGFGVCGTAFVNDSRLSKTLLHAPTATHDDATTRRRDESFTSRYRQRGCWRPRYARQQPSSELRFHRLVSVLRFPLTSHEPSRKAWRTNVGQPSNCPGISSCRRVVASSCGRSRPSAWPSKGRDGSGTMAAGRTSPIPTAIRLQPRVGLH